MTDFNDLSSNREFGGIQVSTIVTAANISPKTILTYLSGAGSIINIKPPVDGFHILYFINLEDFILIAPGGNIILPGSVPYSIGADFVYSLYFNPLTKKYYIQTNLGVA